MNIPHKPLGQDEPRLSARQKGAIACLIDGMTHAEAAAAMGATPSQFHQVMREVRVKYRARTTERVVALAVGQL